MSKIILFPEWKKGASPADRFRELALLAEEDPDRFELCFVAWQPADDHEADRGFITVPSEIPRAFLLGLLDLLKNDIIKR